MSEEEKMIELAKASQGLASFDQEERFHPLASPSKELSQQVAELTKKQEKNKRLMALYGGLPDSPGKLIFKELARKKCKCDEKLGDNPDCKLHVPLPNAINHPTHYNHFGIECADVTDHFNFNLGNAMKYIWRCEHKGKKLEDLKKAIIYLQREIEQS